LKLPFPLGFPLGCSNLTLFILSVQLSEIFGFRALVEGGVGAEIFGGPFC